MKSGRNRSRTLVDRRHAFLLSSLSAEVWSLISIMSVEWCYRTFIWSSHSRNESDRHIRSNPCVYDDPKDGWFYSKEIRLLFRGLQLNGHRTAMRGNDTTAAVSAKSKETTRWRADVRGNRRHVCLLLVVVVVIVVLLENEWSNDKKRMIQWSTNVIFIHIGNGR